MGAIAAHAAAEAPPDAVRVPGGLAAIRRLLNLDTTRPPDTFFLDLHQALLAGSEWNAGWSQVEPRRAVVAFAEDLSAFRTKFGPTVTLSFEPQDLEETLRFLAWLGVKAKPRGGEVTTEIRDGEHSVRRRAFFDAAFAIPAPMLISRLRAGERVAAAAIEESAPLPFGLATWRELLDEPRLSAGDAFLELVKNVEGSRLLVSLHALDAETREGLRAIARAGKGSALRDEDVLDRLARFPGALALSGGEIALPGGREANPAWADIFGVSPSNAPAFLRALFEKDAGRGAYVVEVLQQLPEPVTRALIFGSSGSGADAVLRLRKLYLAIEETRRALELSRRDPYDFAHLARFLRVGPSGDLALLPLALDGEEFPKSESDLDEIVARAARHREAPEDALARLVRSEVGAGRNAPRAVSRYLLVSSLIEGRPGLEDAGVIALLLRGADRFGSAYALLEDAPFQLPALARRYLFAVDRLDRRKPSREQEVAAALFQAGAELLAGAYRAGSLSESDTSALFSGFLDVPLFSRGELAPAKGERDLYGWISARLLPALASRLRKDPATGPDGDAPTEDPTAGEEGAADELLSRALVGSPAPASFEWNGGYFRFDAGADERERKREFRAKQRLASLEDLETIHRERDVLVAAVARGDRAAALGSAAALADRLGLAEETGLSDARLLEEREDAREALERAGKVSRPLPPAQIEKDLGPVDAVVAERLVEALVGHVYAAAADDPDDLYFEDPDFVRRHSFRTVDKVGRRVESAFAPTSLTSETTGGGSRVSGSLFGLSAVLALLHADQITYKPGALIANENIRSGLIAPAWRLSPARLDDDALRFVAASCRATEELAMRIAGRDRAERLRVWLTLARDLVPRSRLGPLAELGPGEASPEAVSRFLSPSDLYGIGRRLARGGAADSLPIPDSAAVAKQALAALEERLGAAGARERLTEFGPRAIGWAGRLRLTDLDLPPYEMLAAYRTPQLFADRLYDWKIAVARTVADAGLPAAILPLVLPRAVDDMMSDLTMAFPYDWSSVVRRSSRFAAADLGRVLDDGLQAGRLLRDHVRDTAEGNR